MNDMVDEESSVIGGSGKYYGSLNTDSLSTNSEQQSPISTSLSRVDDLEKSDLSPDRETLGIHSQLDRDLFYSLFSRRGKDLVTYRYPSIPPERRGKRHRSSNFRRLNDFRHWWKTSRLLVRISGALVFSFVIFKWDDVLSQLSKHNKRKGIKTAVKAMKKIGQGGMSRTFLKGVQPFTRTIRLYMAFMRGIEATVDNRFWEVLIAEAMAFMGNRSIRWWMRHIVDLSCKFYVFPFVMTFLPLPQDGADCIFRVVIIMMGFLRAILPFASSFLGSRIGRQTTFAAIDRLNCRWKTVQNVQDFVVHAGTFRPTAEDPTILRMAKDVAKAIAHGDNPLEVRNRLERLGFNVMGTGAGGISVYRYFPQDSSDTKFHLHVTPYGPSIVDEIPRYIVLEKLHLHQLGSSSKTNKTASVSGFTYSGCFFTSQEWAALKTRFDRELASFDTACKYMGYKSNSAFVIENFIPPPTDLVSLKSFVRTGRFPKKKKRDNARWAEVRKKVDHLSHKILDMKRQGIAPKGVIIYMEGLDCAGKSSTGGLIMEALESAGYDMSLVQYNRPPTEEDLCHSWMWRFRKPSIQNEDGKGHKAALVWDRGPAGDFVYGALRDLSQHEKQQRYYEFHRFEEKCMSEGILFLKLLFVTDRDSISSTLGKRLAHRRIVKDLHVWLDANSTYHERDGLKEIEEHIDPTDFVALNQYESNLRAFYDFVLRTDDVGQHHINGNDTVSCRYLPWLIINTSKRHLARLQIMASFERILDQFSENNIDHSQSPLTKIFDSTRTHVTNGGTEIESLMDSVGIIEEMGALNTSDNNRVKNNNLLYTKMMGSFPYFLCMVVIACSYFHQTWKVDFWGDVMY